MTDEALSIPSNEVLSSEEESIDTPDLPLEEAEDKGPDCEPLPEESEKSNETDDVEALRNEITELRRKLDERQGYFERMNREIGEFSSLFPERTLSEIPDSVWDEVRSGIPLAASYALYEKKLNTARKKAERVNSKNKESSTGAIGRTTVEGFFTPEEVRAMSRDEIKKHYPKIIESMKKWN